MEAFIVSVSVSRSGLVGCNRQCGNDAKNFDAPISPPEIPSLAVVTSSVKNSKFLMER